MTGLVNLKVMRARRTSIIQHGRAAMEAERVARRSCVQMTKLCKPPGQALARCREFTRPVRNIRGCRQGGAHPSNAAQVNSSFEHFGVSVAVRWRPTHRNGLVTKSESLVTFFFFFFEKEFQVSSESFPAGPASPHRPSQWMERPRVAPGPARHARLLSDRLPPHPPRPTQTFPAHPTTPGHDTSLASCG